MSVAVARYRPLLYKELLKADMHELQSPIQEGNYRGWVRVTTYQ